MPIPHWHQQRNSPAMMDATPNSTQHIPPPRQAPSNIPAPKEKRMIFGMVVLRHKVLHLQDILWSCKGQCANEQQSRLDFPGGFA